ncbi:MAG: TRAP transporter small permease subunit [Betaproteobacteria bacterium]
MPRIVLVALLAALGFPASAQVITLKFSHVVAPDLEWPRWAVYLCIPLGSALMCLRFLQVLWRWRRQGVLPSHAPLGVGESAA